MTTLPFMYLMQGNLTAALAEIFNNYIAYGMIWILFGGILFALVYGKTKSYGISGIIFAIYAALIGAVVPVETQPYLLLLIGVLMTVMMFKLVIK